MKMLANQISPRVLAASLTLAASLAAAPAFADTTFIAAVPGASAASVTTLHTAMVPVTHRIIHKTYRCTSVTAYGLDYVASHSACIPVYWFSYYTTYRPVSVAETQTAIVPTISAAVTTLP